MVLTVGEVARRLETDTGGPLPSPYDWVTVINEAGEHFVNMKRGGWGFLERPPVLLDFKLNQNFVYLPDDFGQMKSIENERSITRRFHESTIGEIIRLRSQAITAGALNTWYAIVAEDPGASGGPGRYRLELYPNPSEDSENAIVLGYTARWKPVNDDGDTLRIQSFAEPLYMEIARAIAWGYQEGKDASVTMRLEGMDRSSLAMAAFRADGGRKRWLGQTRGGAIKQIKRAPRIHLEQSLREPS